MCMAYKMYMCKLVKFVQAEEAVPSCESTSLSAACGNEVFCCLHIYLYDADVLHA